jgi:hypothetical protein
MLEKSMCQNIFKIFWLNLAQLLGYFSKKNFLGFVLSVCDMQIRLEHLKQNLKKWRKILKQQH